MNISPEERRVLGDIEPYVLMAASSLITCCYQQDFSVFESLSQPYLSKAVARGGIVEFRTPAWLPVEDALLSTANGRLHSIIRHLAVKRAAVDEGPSTRMHRLVLGGDLCPDGESVSLTYWPWFRFAAPPYRFDTEGRAAAYVAAALGQLARAKGTGVRLELGAERSVLWLSERLRVEFIGAARLTEVAVLLDELETSLNVAGQQLSVARPMFPDVFVALRSAAEAGETFRDVTLLLEEGQALLYFDRKAGDVSS